MSLIRLKLFLLNVNLALKITAFWEAMAHHTEESAGLNHLGEVAKVDLISIGQNFAEVMLVFEMHVDNVDGVIKKKLLTLKTAF